VPSENQEEFTSIFILMDYWERDLVKLLNLPKIELTEDHALTILYNVLCGVKFLHETGVMHRDLKPANILINQECEVRICDFGMSKVMKK
jgi:mitogen-activated protein kinase 1/3